GCSHGDRMIGNFGDAEVFSFHATKFFNTFEGGAVATNDDDLAQRIRLMQNFGFTGLDTVVYVGTNGKM
ncbi:MAG: DegT/DnrJ/EryC1/StrS family aminotransferase, partial [Anaerolineae bacterium]|nr:DegT/DnrJ/EryC1/StrS family aminotransferase [Anaerolineae bacterium]